MKVKRAKRSTWLITGLIVLGLIILSLFWYRNRPYFATVYLETPTRFQAGATVTLPLFVDTKAEIINAGEVYLNFDPSGIEVVAVSKDKSFFTLWITDQPTFSNEKGEISFAGGLPTPGFPDHCC